MYNAHFDTLDPNSGGVLTVKVSATKNLHSMAMGCP
jgi:hypothetical protein